MGVRWREPRDLPALVRVFDEVTAEGRYPPHRPAGLDGYAPGRDELAAFVHEDDDGGVAGHVAVHRSTAASLMDVAARTLDVPIEHLGVVARLFVTPGARRSGVATALLDAATNFCRTIPRSPILDVWEGLPEAIALYERLGWTRIGVERFTFGSSCTDACVHDGDSIRSYLYTYPITPGPGPRRGP